MLIHPKGYTTQPEKNQKNHFENKNRKKTIKPYRIEFRSLTEFQELQIMNREPELESKVANSIRNCRIYLQYNTIINSTSFVVSFKLLIPQKLQMQPSEFHLLQLYKAEIQKDINLMHIHTKIISM
jgi:hypothetical protein